MILRSLLLSLSVASQLWPACPTDRPLVRTASDPEAVPLAALVPQTIPLADFLKLPRPAATAARAGEAETKLFRVAGRIVAVREQDESLVFTLRDTGGATLDAFLPSPRCATAGPFLDKIRDSRQYWLEKQASATAAKPLDVEAAITGIGFYSASSIVLQPVVSLEFGPPSAAVAPAGFPSPAVAYWMTTAAMILLYLVLLIGSIRRLGMDSTWSLGKALSDDGKPSASRLIAFLGLQAMLVLYIGGGQIAIWRLFQGLSAPDLTNYFLVGLGLFAPYAVSQFREGVINLGAGAATATATAAGALAAASVPSLQIQPSSISAANPQPFTITGTGFTASTTVNLVAPGAVIVPATVSLTSSTTLTCTLRPPAAGAPYSAQLIVMTPGLPPLHGKLQVTA